MGNIRRVYSTESGRFCPECGRPKVDCICGTKKKAAPKGDGIVRVRREVKGRKGKTVTVVDGVPLGGDELKELAKGLKQRLGTGGSVKNGTVEIQGDHAAAVIEQLQGKGWTVKKAGG